MTVFSSISTQARAEEAAALGRARQVHHAVEGDAGLHRRVGVLEAGLEGRVPGREREQGAEVSAGRSAADRDERGSPPYSPMCSLTQATRPLDVDDVVGPGRLGAEPVVDGDADPAAGHQLEHHRLALLALVADHPRPAVDVDHHRRLPGRREPRPVDVEAVALLAVAPVVEVARRLDGPRLEGDGPGHPPPSAPGRRGRLGGHGEGVPRTSASAAAVTSVARRPVIPSPISPTQPATATARPSQPAQPSRAPKATKRTVATICQTMFWKASSPGPSPGEADDGQGLPPDRAVGERHGDGSDDGDGQEGVRHPTIFARSGRSPQVRPGRRRLSPVARPPS